MYDLQGIVHVRGYTKARGRMSDVHLPWVQAQAKIVHVYALQGIVHVHGYTNARGRMSDVLLPWVQPHTCMILH